MRETRLYMYFKTLFTRACLVAIQPLQCTTVRSNTSLNCFLNTRHPFFFTNNCTNDLTTIIAIKYLDGSNSFENYTNNHRETRQDKRNRSSVIRTAIQHWSSKLTHIDI